MFSKEQSRQFGFLRFANLEDAESFMDKNYPILYLYGDSEKSSGNPEECKVRILYGKERKENKSEEADWNCSSVGRSHLISCGLTDDSSVTSTTLLLEQDVSDARLLEQVWLVAGEF
jgi:hypothetical protein